MASRRNRCREVRAVGTSGAATVRSGVMTEMLIGL
jgi:hypothetical protein